MMGIIPSMSSRRYTRKEQERWLEQFYQSNLNLRNVIELPGCGNNETFS